MRKTQRNVGQSLTRVKGFLNTHADTLGALATTPAQQQLDAAITAFNGHAATQDSAKLSAAANAEGARQAAATLRNEYMVPIAKFARKTLRGAPDFAALAHVSNTQSGHSLVAAARAMATAATPLSAKFTEAQLGSDYITQLSAQADQLDAVLTQRDATRSSLISSTSGIKKALASGREAVAILDPVVTRMLGNSELVAAWHGAKRIANVPTSSASAPVTTPTPTTPTTPTTPAPATSTPEVKTA